MSLVINQVDSQRMWAGATLPTLFNSVNVTPPKTWQSSKTENTKFDSTKICYKEQFYFGRFSIFFSRWAAAVDY